jgi:hypothetical protein
MAQSHQPRFQAVPIRIFFLALRRRPIRMESILSERGDHKFSCLFEAGLGDAGVAGDLREDCELILQSTIEPSSLNKWIPSAAVPISVAGIPVMTQQCPAFEDPSNPALLSAEYWMFLSASLRPHGLQPIAHGQGSRLAPFR